MKHLLLLLLLITALDTTAQRKRRILFDADTKTPVDSGFYGIGVVDNQAYLINHRKDSVKFKMEYPFVRAWHTGKDLNFTLLRTHPAMIVIVKDSVTITLPLASDTLNKSLMFDINYLGVRGGTGTNKFIPYDATTRMVFSDSIRYYNAANQTTYRTKVFDHLATYPWFSLKPSSRFLIYILNNKWYLSFADFDY